jgi:transcription elongation GreA/GreB family factor
VLTARDVNGTLFRVEEVDRVNKDGPKLSAQARRSLEHRLAELEDERVPRLEGEFAASHDPLTETALRKTREEAGRVREALATATPLEDEPHDPTIVELGDSVTIRWEGSAKKERFTLVGELEARMDETWISHRAPFGAGLLGSSVGQLIRVQAPGGEQRFEVLSIERG